MFKRKLMLTVGALFLLAGCAANKDYALVQTKSADTQTARVTDRSIEYRILPQDRLEIALYKDPAQASEGVSANNELGQSMNQKGMLVNAAGYVSLPLIGKTKVSGLPSSEITLDHSPRYRKYFQSLLN